MSSGCNSCTVNNDSRYGVSESFVSGLNGLADKAFEF